MNTSIVATKVFDNNIADIITENFDLCPSMIIYGLGLRKLIYRQITAYGYLGYNHIEFPWESIDKAESLKSEAGL